MNGIEKITEKILGDAYVAAAETLNAADSEAGDLIAAAESRADAIRRTYDSRCADLNAELSSRAESVSESEFRNAELIARAKLVDRVFNEAKERLLSLDEKGYYTFLSKLLKNVAAERAEADKAIAAGNDEYDDFDGYELQLNPADRARFGDKLIDSLKGKIGKKPISVSDKDCDIDGGFILRWGQVDVNCSISRLIEGARDAHERDVCAILYPTKDEKDSK